MKVNKETNFVLDTSGHELYALEFSRTPFINSQNGAVS